MRIQLTEWRQSRNLAVVVVTAALCLDSVLFEVIVPILPHLLHHSLYTDAESSENAVTFQNSFVAPWTGYYREEITEFIYSSGTSNTSMGFQAPSSSSDIGVLLSSEMLFKIIATPFCGIMADRFGKIIPMLTGFSIMFSSTLLFMFAESYELLFVARSVQGLGSAAVFAPGMSFIADKYLDDNERASAISTAFGGVIFGKLIGPVFGGVMYQFYGKTVTFSILAAVILVIGCGTAFIAEPKFIPRIRGPSVRVLLIDPYILLVLGGVVFVGLSYSILESLLPEWMMDTMNTNSAEQGFVFVPTFLTQLFVLVIVNRLSLKIEKCLIAMLGLILLGFCLMLLPLAKTQVQLILPAACLGLAIGLADCSLIPLLGYLADLRHESMFGIVFALEQFTYCMAYVVGASLSGTLEAITGFEFTLSIAGIASIVYAPLLCCLRNPRRREEEQPLCEKVV